jgi:hypothetical protein
MSAERVLYRYHTLPHGRYRETAKNETGDEGKQAGRELHGGA